MYRLLLADDEGIVIDALKFIINKNFPGIFQIETAKTGRSVIELAESYRPEIAIMDIQMPGINGIEAIKEIKKFNASTVFVVLSAYDKFDYAKEAINQGVLEYLNKPIVQDQIVDVLNRATALIDKEKDRRRSELIIREKMETVIPIIENGLVQNLLFREHFEEDIHNFKNILSIEEEYGYMVVLICGEEQVGNHMTNAVGATIRMQNAYKDIREVISGFLHGPIGDPMANKIPILVPCKANKLDYNERIEVIDRCRELVRKLASSYDLYFRAGIGGVKTLSELKDSYDEAIRSLLFMDGKVGHASDLPINCTYEENYPIDMEKLLFEQTQKGDADGAALTAGQFFDWMVENYLDDMMDIKLKVLEFVLWAEHLSYEEGGREYRFESRQDYLPTVYSCEDIEELKQWFIEKVSSASRNVYTRKEQGSETVIEKARKYIMAQFNKDISLDDVSREVDISPYYFSKVFKEETGQNFIEYLTELRIERAKDLLTNSNLSIKEICIESGYADPNYFSRIFRKNVGVTPTEYRE